MKTLAGRAEARRKFIEQMKAAGRKVIQIKGHGYRGPAVVCHRNEVHDLQRKLTVISNTVPITGGTVALHPVGVVTRRKGKLLTAIRFIAQILVGFSVGVASHGLVPGRPDECRTPLLLFLP